MLHAGEAIKMTMTHMKISIENILVCYTQWRSQVTDDARALQAFFFCFFFVFGRGGGGRGWGMAPLVNFCILEVATQIVLGTIFEMPSVLNRE